MKFPTSAWLLGVLQINSHFCDTVAKPLSTFLELRIRKVPDSDDSTLKNYSVPTVHEIFLNERIISPLSDYQPSASTLAILENLSIMHHQKRGAQIFKRGEASQKRKIFGRAKNCKNRKYKLCGGAFKMFWNATKQQCEACSDGKEASPKGDACVDRKLSDEERERGQCPPGKRLDPNVPGQDANTENPKCIDKDQQNRCPEGQSESTPTKSKPATCAPDSEPDKKCENGDQYVHKEVGPDGKMKNTCRLTKENENKKAQKGQEKIKEARGRTFESKDREKRERKGRARRAACLALGAMTFLAEVDVEALGELELEGLIEPDDHSHVPDIALEDYMVTIKLPESVTVPGTNTAGFNPAAIAKALVRFFKGGPAGGAAAQRPPIPIQPGARLFGGANKGEGTGSSRFAALRKGATNIIHKRARPEAKSAAGKSQAVQNILKSKTFQECLAIGAGVALGQVATKREEARNKYTTEYGSKHILEIDLDAQKKNNYPAPEDNETTILMVMDANTDAGEDEDPDGYLSTYQDNYNREDRLRYEGCGSVLYSNEVTLLQTWNGCCKYYDGDNCEPETGVFKQTDREDGELRGKNNDAVSSYWCNFDRNCTGAPGG